MIHLAIRSLQFSSIEFESRDIFLVTRPIKSIAPPWDFGEHTYPILGEDWVLFHTERTSNSYSASIYRHVQAIDCM